MLTNAAFQMPMAVEPLGGGPVKKPRGMEFRGFGPAIEPAPSPIPAAGPPMLATKGPAPVPSPSPLPAPSAVPVPPPIPMSNPGEPLRATGGPAAMPAQPAGPMHKPLPVPGQGEAPRPAKPSQSTTLPSARPARVAAPAVSTQQAGAGGFDVEAFRPFADATYSEATRQLDPMFRQREADFRQRMVNQGLQEGTEAFDNAFDNFSRERNDAFSSARNQALAQALGAQNQFFGQSFNNAQLAQQGELANAQMGLQANLANAQMGLQADLANASNMLNLFGLGENNRQFNANLGQRESEFGRTSMLNLFGLGENSRQFNANLGQREAEFGRTFGEGQRQFDSQFGFGRERADMQDLMSLLGYGQQTTNYNNSLLGMDQQRAGALFGLIPGLTPTQLDVMGAANMWNQQHMQGRQLQQDARNGTMQAIGQLGGAALMMSDSRLKTDVSRVGTLDNGLPVYRYRYKAGGPMHIGVMAQDVQQVRPEAVGEVGGFLAVDYAEATK